jgi:hypothetical protein
MADDQEGYVHSLNEFKTHTANHIQNVGRLGMHLFYQHRSSLFNDVPEYMLREKLLHHDFEKLASSQKLSEYGYSNSKSFAERLYEFYGKNKNDSARIKELVHELNSYAEQYDEEFFKKYDLVTEDGKLTQVAEKIILIEKIADLVEREKNPVSPEEFGVERMIRASSIFNHPFEKTLAHELANFYLEVVKPNPLIYMVKSNNGAPVCSSLFN